MGSANEVNTANKTPGTFRDLINLEPHARVGQDNRKTYEIHESGV